MEETTVKLSILDFSVLTKLFLYFVTEQHFMFPLLIGEGQGEVLVCLTFKPYYPFGQHFMSLFHINLLSWDMNIHLIIPHISPSRLSFRCIVKLKKNISTLILRILAKNYPRCPLLFNIHVRDVSNKLIFHTLMWQFLRCPKVVYLVDLFHITAVLNLIN